MDQDVKMGHENPLPITLQHALL